jgi:hypothetical protein
MKKTVIQGIPRQAISIRKEAPLHMPLPMGIGLKTSTGIIQAVQSIMTLDGKFTFI